MKQEVITCLSRVGFDNVLAHLTGGFESCLNAGKEIDTVNRITVDGMASEIEGKDVIVIDVRKEAEYAAEHVKSAYNNPLVYINYWINTIDANQPFYLHCVGGYRSMIAASILQGLGFRSIIEIDGGFNAIAQTEIAKTNFLCQSKVFK